jgi:FHA domain
VAQLREANGSRSCVLEHEHLVGRSPASDLVLAAAYVSSRHAVIRWSDDGWVLRDLGSQNGTFLNGKPVRPGETQRLEPGQRLAFGSIEQEWLLTDAAPPRPHVVSLDTPDEEPLEGEVIGIPSSQNPLGTVYQGSDGQWMLERADEPNAVLRSGDTFSVNGARFRFSCPDLVAPTSMTEVPADITQARLLFAVSRDEEYVKLSAELDGRRLDLGSRAHNYLLLVLARQRLQDREQGLPESSCGWIYQDMLTDRLRVAGSQVNLEVCRLRRQLSDLKIPAAAAIIERRAGTKQLRIGVAAIEITAL